MSAFRMVPVKENKNRNDDLGAVTEVKKCEKAEMANFYLMKMGGNFVAYKLFCTTNRGKNKD